MIVIVIDYTLFITDNTSPGMHLLGEEEVRVGSAKGRIQAR